MPNVDGDLLSRIWDMHVFIIALKVIALFALTFYLGYRQGTGKYICKKCGEARRVNHE